MLALKEICVDVEQPAEPSLMATDTVWHLASPITARLEDAATAPSALRLAQMLHPTPAVGGVPAEAAAEAIADLEGDLRDYFAGCVGWVDGSGDGVFAVTIRAAVIDGARCGCSPAPASSRDPTPSPRSPRPAPSSTR